MSRPLPRAWILAIVLGVCLIGPGRSAHAQATLAGGGMGQGGVFNDPFTFYYSVYLPNQAAQAMRPSPLDTINAATAQRQQYAASQQRRSLYNPSSPYAQEEFNPLSHYSDQKGMERQGHAPRFVQDPSNSDGSGPSAYYSRATQYYPGLRDGRSPNANVYKSRPKGGMGGMGGMGGGGMGGMGGMG